jgi:hypothetical protein
MAAICERRPAKAADQPSLREIAFRSAGRGSQGSHSP